MAFDPTRARRHPGLMSATQAQRVTNVPIFRFMDLPAEIRNRVYEQCEEHIPAHGDRILHLAPRTSLKISRLQFYNLTVANQHLRREFRAIYMARTPKWVSYKHFARYVEDFHGNAEDFQDNIIIDLVDLCKKDAAPDEDFLPLLLQITHYPNLLIRFRTLATAHKGASLFGLSPILNKCDSKSETDEWTQIATEQVTRIVTRNSTRKVVVYVKEKYKMEGKGRKAFEEALKSKMGLDGGISWTEVIKYE